MDDRQPSKRRKQATEEMEKDLNRSSLHQHGSVGRPSHDVSPRTTPLVEPTTIQPLPSNETGQGASTARSAPPPEGNAAPVADAPTGLFYDGPSYSGMQGAYPEGYEHGENYGGRLATRFNLTLVDNDKAASRAEWLYHNQRQASRMAAYGDPYSRSFPCARSSSLRTSFDGRERESASPPRPSNELRASWRGRSVTWWPRLPLQWRRPRPIMRRSVRVSFTCFIFILNC
jgi:hypothetical protein